MYTGGCQHHGQDRKAGGMGLGWQSQHTSVCCSRLPAPGCSRMAAAQGCLKSFLHFTTPVQGSTPAGGLPPAAICFCLFLSFSCFYDNDHHVGRFIRHWSILSHMSLPGNILRCWPAGSKRENLLSCLFQLLVVTWIPCFMTLSSIAKAGEGE